MYDFDLYFAKLKEKISDGRYEHSVNVAKAAVKLAKIYGEDSEKARVAGLLHDIAKEMSTEEHLEILKKSNLPFENFAKVSPKVLHGPAGSAYVKENLKITDESILGAIRYHTTGRENMTLFEKIIFVADYISDERDFIDSPEVRKIAETDINEAVLHKLSTSIKKCVNFRRAIHPDTISAYNQIVWEKGDVIKNDLNRKGI